MSDPLLSVEGLGVAFGPISVTQDVSFAIAPGERVGMVGESGCGKTVTGLALLRLLPAARLTGRVMFEGQNVLRLPKRQLRRVRGGRIGMIFQEPMSALDPVFTVGEQIAETLRTHRGLSRAAAAERAVEILDSVGIPLPRRRAENYPHQLSGGMRQRAMIAIAIACEPALLIADEPTTALDVTVQAQILDLLRDLQRETGMAIVLITHDLGVVAEMADEVAVMYSGRVVERATAAALFDDPQHPYTLGLLGSVPRLEQTRDRLLAIEGTVPSAGRLPPGCRFHPRCVFGAPACMAAQPPLLALAPGHEAACIRAPVEAIAA